MLRLKLPTDKKWAELAQNNLKEVMIDHAFCEQKAASSAISIIINYPEYSELVSKLSEIAIEEMEHFKAVHNKILERGWVLGKERRDYYIHDLAAFMPKTSDKKVNLIYKLLLSAMIEARSCERFRVLYTFLKDKDAELAEFYHTLEQSEAMHYTVFLNFARQYGNEIMDVDAKWEEFLAYESEVISKYGDKELIHG